MKNDTMPRNWAEAKAAGYRATNTSLQRGYVRVGLRDNDMPVRVAGGSRKGQLYVLMHNPQSTMYCIRQYIAK